jgi:hypothetical protein
VRRLLVAVAATAAITGCGGDASSPASVVPGDAPVYVSVAAGPPAQQLVDRLGMRALNYREDVRPWIGKRAAFFGTRDEGAGLVLSIRDEEAAREWAERTAGINEFSFWDIVDGQLVLASTQHVLAAARKAAEQDRALADGDAFEEDQERGDDAPAALLLGRDKRATTGATTWFSGLPDETQSAVIELLPDRSTVTARAWVTDDELRVDVSGLGPPRPAPPRLDDLTGAAWLAVATPNLGTDLLTAAGVGLAGPSLFTRAEIALDVDLEDDVMANLGPATLLVQGSTQEDFSAQAQVALHREEPIRKATLAAARALPNADPFRNATIVNFFAPLGDPTGTGLLDTVVAHVENERLVVRSGVQVGGTDEDLGETATYRDAERRLGGPPILFVKLAPAAKLLGLPPQDQGAYFAATERTVDGKRFNRFVLVRP